jgi:hypothetical protein
MSTVCAWSALVWMMILFERPTLALGALATRTPSTYTFTYFPSAITWTLKMCRSRSGIFTSDPTR